MASVDSTSIVIMVVRKGCQVRIHALTVSFPRCLLSSHTNIHSAELDLPEYESYESLRSHVLTAITAGSEYFGFA